jgi:hypothetical protein
MRRFLVGLLVACSLFAEGPYQEEEETYSYWDFHPVHVGGNLIRFGKAEISDTPEGGHLFYRKSNAYAYVLVPVSKTSYFFPRVEWNAFTMNWDKNPKFHEDHFYYFQFALTFYSTGLDKWRWIARGSYNIDMEHFNNPSLYGLYEALLWGAYQPHRKWHYHMGALGYTGYEGREIYPMIGFDFSPNKKWTFQFIFPIDYSIQYNVGEHWRFSLKGRPLKERFRTGKKEPQPRSVFCYSTTGAEFNVHYERHLRLEIEAFIGYNFGGSFYIKNASGHDALYTDVGSSPYAGASLNFGF